MCKARGTTLEGDKNIGEQMLEGYKHLRRGNKGIW